MSLNLALSLSDVYIRHWWYHSRLCPEVFKVKWLLKNLHILRAFYSLTVFGKLVACDSFGKNCYSVNAHFQDLVNTDCLQNILYFTLASISGLSHASRPGKYTYITRSCVRFRLISMHWNSYSKFCWFRYSYKMNYLRLYLTYLCYKIQTFEPYF